MFCNYKSLSIFIIILSLHHLLWAQNYYVDYDAGNDMNDGLSQNSAWQHCPGDNQANGLAHSAILSPGDKIIFNSNVSYRGSITVTESGTTENPICYLGNAWGSGRAIMDGSILISGWTDEGDGIFSSPIPEGITFGLAGSFNIHQSVNGENKSFNVSQFPKPDDPFFFDDISTYRVLKNEDLTLTSIRDKQFFTQSDPKYWEGSNMLIFTNPNIVVEREIEQYDPQTNTVYFSSLNVNAIFPDGRDHNYAIYNSKIYLNNPGEYYIDFENSKIYILPWDAENIGTSITCSTHTIAFNLNDKNHISVEGFTVQNYGGDIFLDAVGVGKSSLAHIPSEGIRVVNNTFSENRNGSKGNGAVYLPNCSYVYVADNEISYNTRSAGIFVTLGNNVIIENNIIRKCGSTNIRLYTVKDAIVSQNKIYEAKGRHANGITTYLGCYNVLVASNEIHDAITPITFQNSANLYFHNNIIDSRTWSAGINEWGRTTNPSCTSGDIFITNNTILTLESTPAINVEKSLDTTLQGDVLVSPNQYYAYNNILDAGGLILNPDNSDYNLYTSLSWQQTGNWMANSNDIIGDRDFDFMFESYDSDFRNTSESLANGSGTNLSSILPLAKFPEYDFTLDYYGQVRPDQFWSIGASESSMISKVVEINKETTVNVFPNPASDYVLLRTFDNKKIEAVKLYSVNGILLHNQQVADNDCTIEIEYPSGIYILEIVLENKIEKQWLFIK